MATEQEFYELCKRHDLTYVYSDDNRCFQRGKRERNEIDLKAQSLPRPISVKIWNRVVDEKITPEFRDQFYWKE